MSRRRRHVFAPISQPYSGAALRQEQVPGIRCEVSGKSTSFPIAMVLVVRQRGRNPQGSGARCQKRQHRDGEREGRKDIKVRRSKPEYYRKHKTQRHYVVLLDGHFRQFDTVLTENARLGATNSTSRRDLAANVGRWRHQDASRDNQKHATEAVPTPSDHRSPEFGPAGTREPAGMPALRRCRSAIEPGLPFSASVNWTRMVRAILGTRPGT